VSPTATPAGAVTVNVAPTLLRSVIITPPAAFAFSFLDNDIPTIVIDALVLTVNPVDGLVLTPNPADGLSLTPNPADDLELVVNDY
jgi:hypothetical protein